MTELALQHRPHEEQYEGGPSPFLTDREGAELTALSTLGPLALVAFDTEPQTGLRPTPEHHQVPDTINDTVDGFAVEELMVAMRRQENVSRAALMFAARDMN
ncbi:MAG TPA: hypothetical protein VJM32_03220 [Candidatus Saccharimonadales bacterium]|nr:hypothetical protein [Candidatus Saccharimonadales bacterium]